jgi:hypothetical protein
MRILMISIHDVLCPPDEYMDVPETCVSAGIMQLQFEAVTTHYAIHVEVQVVEFHFIWVWS